MSFGKAKHSMKRGLALYQRFAVIAEADGSRDASMYGTNRGGSRRGGRCTMFSNGSLKRLLAAATIAFTAACSQMGPSASNTDAAGAAKTTGAACRAPDGSMVSDSTVVYRCAVPGQGITSCPRYTCRRCTNGAWSGEYS